MLNLSKKKREKREKSALSRVFRGVLCVLMYLCLETHWRINRFLKNENTLCMDGQAIIILQQANSHGKAAFHHYTILGTHLSTFNHFDLWIASLCR